MDDAGRLDITIDGADEFDQSMNLIKGGGERTFKKRS